MPRRPRSPRFDAAWNRRRRAGGLWRRLRWPLALALLFGVLALFEVWRGAISPAEWQRVEQRFNICGEGGDACVYDGDTVFTDYRTRIRLSGYDAPELDGACEAERVKAVEARAALLVWLNAGPFEWDGGSEPPRDQYGRALRSARRDGESLADRMVAQGLAAESGWGYDPVNWCG